MRKIHSQVSVDLPQPVIRPYDPKDGDAVRSMCFSHFRGLSLPAVQYYVAQHLTDFAVLTLLGYLFTGAIRKVIAMSCLFLLYLFVRAYYEMRAYILYNCPDLMSIEKSYAGTSSFWVAEITGPKGARIVGCVGIAPSRTVRYNHLVPKQHRSRHPAAVSYYDWSSFLNAVECESALACCSLSRT